MSQVKINKRREDLKQIDTLISNRQKLIDDAIRLKKSIWEEVKKLEEEDKGHIVSSNVVAKAFSVQPAKDATPAPSTYLGSSRSCSIAAKEELQRLIKQHAEITGYLVDSLGKVPPELRNLYKARQKTIAEDMRVLQEICDCMQRNSLMQP